MFVVASLPSLGSVLDAKLQLVMDGFSVVWTLFGTPSASGVTLVIDQYQSMRYKIRNTPDLHASASQDK
jgi:hypothetical protein